MTMGVDCVRAEDL